jgi:hypothetical protein
MSGVPAGFNPEATPYFQGGDSSTITPVQGGGGDQVGGQVPAAAASLGEQLIQAVVAVPTAVAPAAPAAVAAAPKAQNLAEETAAQTAAIAAYLIVHRATKNPKLAETAAAKAGAVAINRKRSQSGNLVTLPNGQKAETDVITAEDAEEALKAVSPEEKAETAEVAQAAIAKAQIDGVPADQHEKIGIKAAVKHIKAKRRTRKRRAEKETVEKLAELTGITPDPDVPSAVSKPEKVMPLAKTRPSLATRLSKEVNMVADNDVYAEYYKLQDINEGYKTILKNKIAAFSSGSGYRAALSEMMANYEKYAVGLWNSKNANGKGNVLPIMGDRISTLQPNESINIFSRMTYVLPIDTENIVAVPPLRGNAELFLKVLQTLETLKVLKRIEGINDNPDIYEVKRGTVVCFMPPFYSEVKDPITNNNSMLLSMFLNLQGSNPGKVFALSESTAQYVAVGVSLRNARGITGAEHPLINMLEPSYIIYPYRRKELIEGIILSSSKGELPDFPEPASKLSTTLQRLYESRKFGTASVIVNRPNLNETDSTQGYFIVRSDADAGDLPIPKDSLNPKEYCRNAPILAANYMLTDEETLVRNHPVRKLNLVEYMESAATTSVALVVFRTMIKDEYFPLCKDVDTTNPTSAPKDKFYGSPAAFVSSGPLGENSVHFVNTEANGRIFQIRLPAHNNPVKHDWVNEIFTNDEAAFLNSMNLSPATLEMIFPVRETKKHVVHTWQNEVADFLGNLAFSKCFTKGGLNLMTRMECMKSREFINKVYFYFVENSLRSDTLGEFEKQRDEMESGRVRDLMARRTPDIRDAKPATSKQFLVNKTEWNDVNVLLNPIDGTYKTYIMMINKNTGLQEYKAITVPKGNKKLADAKVELEQKIQALRAKYPGHVFIY